jgi:REP element-mobilizing transposase RayT
LGFVTKYRYGVLTSQHIRYLAWVFAKVCQHFGVVLV